MGFRRLTLALLTAAALAGCGSQDDAEPEREGAQAATPSPTATVTTSPVATPTATAEPAEELPSPDGALPRTASGIAAELADVRPRLRAAARAWDGSGAAPEDLTLLSLREQRLVLRTADRPRLVRPVLRALPAEERAAVRDELAAERALTELSSGWPVKRRFKTGKPLPARRLWRFYTAAQERFGVTPSLLAAVNLVESQFGRLRNESVSGAQGPMQFMPATWAAYGLGGDVHDPRDAILGAANYLHANGAPRTNARALYRYNPSNLYVDAVSRYERRMRNQTGFKAFYARQVFVRSNGPEGRRRITGP